MRWRSQIAPTVSARSINCVNFNSRRDYEHICVLCVFSISRDNRFWRHYLTSPPQINCLTPPYPQRSRFSKTGRRASIACPAVGNFAFYTGNKGFVSDVENIIEEVYEVFSWLEILNRVMAKFAREQKDIAIVTPFSVSLPVASAGEKSPINMSLPPLPCKVSSPTRML